MSRRRHGRKEPYTVLELRKRTCVRCGRRPQQQWAACADDNVWRPMCNDCDILLNLLVLVFMGDPAAVAKVIAYQERVRR